MNKNQWEERIARWSVGAMVVLGPASAMTGMAGFSFGHQAVLHAGIAGLVVTTAIGVAAMVAVRIVGNRPRRPGRPCPGYGYPVR